MCSKTVKTHLISKREMLQEYFSICITEDGHLSAIPMLIKGYIPNLEKLPDFLWRLGSEVNTLILADQTLDCVGLFHCCISDA